MFRQKTEKSHNTGFTLIELMIVVAIIAILSAIAIPNFLMARYKSNFSACQQQLKNLQTGYELAIDEWGTLKDVTNEDDVCHFILPGNDQSGTCAGQVGARVDEVCAPGSFSSAPVDEFTYNIMAQSQDRSSCNICVTEKAVRPINYDPTGECTNANPGNCEH
jgi:prepilin-type N-terminal cleavage/methylation domain-containing protein